MREKYPVLGSRVIYKRSNQDADYHADDGYQRFFPAIVTMARQNGCCNLAVFGIHEHTVYRFNIPHASAEYPLRNWSWPEERLANQDGSPQAGKSDASDAK